MPDIDIVDIEATAAEAKEDFELIETLRGAQKREGSIMLFTDEVLAEQHGEAVAALAEAKKEETDSEGFPIERSAESQKLIDALELATEQALAELKKTAITVKLRAVPPLIMKACRRKARKEIGLKGKGIPQDLAEEFSEAFTTHLLAELCTGYINHKTGTERSAITVTGAKALRDLLPEPEWDRLDLKMGDIQFKNVISESATAQADF